MMPTPTLICRSWAHRAATILKQVRLLLQPDEFWEGLIADKRIVRNPQKIMSVRENARFVAEIARDMGELYEPAAEEAGVPLLVDNTMATPWLCRPIDYGATLVVHSTTKFLNGHSDGLGGVIVCTRQDQAEAFGFIQKSVGAILSPFECWLVLRGVKSLAVRMVKHDQNGRAVADFLRKHKKVKKVLG